MPLIKHSGIFVFVILYVCSSCSGKPGSEANASVNDSIPAAKQREDITLPGGFIAQSKIGFDSTYITRFIKQFPAFTKYESKIRKFYSNRNYTYAWFDADGMIEQAGNLHNKIDNITEEGLPEKKLYVDTFHIMVEEAASQSKFQKENIALELMLTAQYFFYAENVWTGLGAKAMQAVNWDLPQKKISYETLLDSLLEIPSSRFMTTEPVYPQYAKLKEQLKKYRAIEKSGGWPFIKADKKVYKNGDSSTTILSIRKRLALTNDVNADNQSPVFDNELETAVKRFQHRYGIKADGIISEKLIAEMNYPVEKRIEQIIVNMERCRWLPVALKKDYVVVNIPEYRFHAYENDSLTWSMDVVVGTALNKTAIFNGMMNMVVFSPYWNIPPGIMKNEILPAIRRDKNYLIRNHMEWNGNAVRQKPGPWNALGKVKFLFPNSHSIYLHDTPSKYPFSQDQRAFSHGCIRVAEPMRLAKYVLRNQPEWTEEKIDAAMKATKEQYVKLKNPVPVFIAYFTAWVDKDGQLNFRNDVYKRDSRLAKMILEQSKL
jgi:L,D-transpeptidase YcbB